nr:endogenous retrovirus group K member 19 Rec protein-like [Gorilla gorilla gorilla]
MNPSEMQRKAPLQRRRHHSQAPSTHQMNKMVISEEQMKLPSTKKVEPPTWAQLKKLTQFSEKSLENTRVTQTPETMLLAALMIVINSGRAQGCLMPETHNWLVEVPTVSTTSRFTYHMSTGVPSSSEETATIKNRP